MACCWPAFGCWKLVPPHHNELSTEELQQLYAQSTQLNQGRLIVQGLFARADARNTNGRVYPRAILTREVGRFRRQHVARGTALGELNHPSYYSTHFRALNLPNISHQVLELRWHGQELWGTIEVLPTPAGLLLSELYSKGIKLGVSSRGWASVVTDPHSQQVVVEPDYQLITFDFVPEPSNAGAYVVPICKRYRKRLPDQATAVSISYLGIGSSSMAQLEQLPPAATLRRWLKHTSRAMDAAAKHPGQVALQAMAAAGAAQPGQQLQAPPSAAGAVGAGPAGTAEQAAWACSRSSSAAGSSHSAAAGVSMLGVLAGAGGVLSADTPLGGGVLLGCHYQVLDKPWLPVDAAVRHFKVHLSLMATKARVHQHQHQHQQHRMEAGPPAGGQRQLHQHQHQQQPQCHHQHHHDHQHHQQQQPAQQAGSQRQLQGAPHNFLQQQQQQQHLDNQPALEQPLLHGVPSDTSVCAGGSGDSKPVQQQQACQSLQQQQQPPPPPPPQQPQQQLKQLLHVTCGDEEGSDGSLQAGTPRGGLAHG